MNYGILDMEMTCDGRREGDKFIDDGRMSRYQREIISVGFIVVDDKYNIKNRYSTNIRPIHKPILTDYCKELTGITQADVDHGKKSNNAFRDLKDLCDRYSIDYVFVFGDFDEVAIKATAKWNKKAKEKTENLFVIKSKTVDVRPAIINAMGGQYKGMGLSKVADELGIKKKGDHHDAIDDAMLLFRVCKKLDIQMMD